MSFEGVRIVDLLARSSARHHLLDVARLCCTRYCEWPHGLDRKQIGEAPNKRRAHSKSAFKSVICRRTAFGHKHSWLAHVWRKPESLFVVSGLGMLGRHLQSLRYLGLAALLPRRYQRLRMVGFGRS